MERTNGDTNVRWSVVSIGRRTSGWRRGRARWRGRGRDVQPMRTDPGSAKTALDRIVIPQDALDRMAGMASPRSSLIISRPLSAETGKGTDFVVLLSGEPQGGIKTRGRAPGTEFPYARLARRLPFRRVRIPPEEPVLLAATPIRLASTRAFLTSAMASSRGCPASPLLTATVGLARRVVVGQLRALKGTAPDAGQ
jgi:hypothetical protein